MRDDDDFRSAFHEHKDAVYRFAWRLTNSAETAEDITQDTFLALLRTPRWNNRSAAQLRSFLLGIARNLALKRWRTEKRWATLEDEHLAATPPEVNGLDVSKAVGMAVAALPPLQREVLLLSSYEGLSLQEMVTITGTELTAVKARLHRARENMKRLLAAWKPAAAKGEKPNESPN